MAAILRESYLLKTGHLTNKTRTPITRIFFKNYSFYFNNWQQGSDILWIFLNGIKPERSTLSCPQGISSRIMRNVLIKYGIFQTFVLDHNTKLFIIII